MKTLNVNTPVKPLIYGVYNDEYQHFSFNFDGLSLLDGDQKEISFHYNSMVAPTLVEKF